ncbi:hypothetical protein PINS_up018746 [Pythium insidiosum]|nr:hypothetical protein PINS_up018746 [Pythium insidiosum]
MTLLELIELSNEDVRQILDELTNSDSSSVDTPIVLEASFTTAELTHDSRRRSGRARRSKIERESRRRRQTTLRAMRQEATHLDQELGRLATALLKQQSSASTNATEEFVASSNGTAASELHGRYLTLKQTTQRLLAEQHDLKHKLLQHQQAHASLWKTLCKSRQEWNSTSGQSRSDAPHDHVPEEEIFRVMHECFDTISKFDLSTDYVSSGMTFLGWRDRRRLDEANGVLNFSFSKFFPGRLAEPMMTTTWNFFTNDPLIEKSRVEERARFSFCVLQRLNDDVVLVRQEVKARNHGPRMVSVCTVFRLRLGGDHWIVTRTLPVPSARQPLEDGEAWLDAFYWYVRQLSSAENEGSHLRRWSVVRVAVQGSG